MHHDVLDSAPSLPNVRPTIVLAGDDHTMGGQYLTQLCDVFGPSIVDGVAGAVRTERDRAIVRSMEAVVRDVAPEVATFLEGVVAGATAIGRALEFDDLLARFTGADTLFDGVAASTADGDGCTGLAAWGAATQRGGLVAAGSKDHQPRPEVSLFVYPTDGGHPYVWTPSLVFGGSGIGGHPGMNDRGLAYVHHGATCWIQCTPQAEWEVGITMPVAVLHTLRFAQNADDAKALQLGYPCGDGRVGGFWVDVDGRSWVIENRSDPVAIRTAGDHGERSYLYAANNGLCREVAHCQDPPPGGQVYVPHGGWSGSEATFSSVARNLQVRSFFETHYGDIDVALVQALFREPGTRPAYPSLQAAESGYLERRGEGWDHRVANQFNATVGIVEPKRGEGGRYLASWGATARGGHPFGPSKHAYPVDPLGTWYEVRLMATAERTVAEASEQAKRDMYEANLQLAELTYQDAAYVPLRARFDEAARWWQHGDHHLTRALGAPSTVVRRLGAALRAFTRAQALARHVLESLAPPEPLSPPAVTERPREEHTHGRTQ